MDINEVSVLSWQHENDRHTNVEGYAIRVKQYGLQYETRSEICSYNRLAINGVLFTENVKKWEPTLPSIDISRMALRELKENKLMGKTHPPEL